MATQMEVINWLWGNVEDLQQLSPTTFSFRKLVEDDRGQDVYFEVSESLVLISSPFSHQGQISSDVALKLVGENTALGMRKVGEFYALAHVVPIEDLDVSEIVVGIHLVGERADELEALLGDDVF